MALSSISSCVKAPVVMARPPTWSRIGKAATSQSPSFSRGSFSSVVAAKGIDAALRKPSTLSAILRGRGCSRTQILPERCSANSSCPRPITSSPCLKIRGRGVRAMGILVALPEVKCLATRSRSAQVSSPFPTLWSRCHVRLLSRNGHINAYHGASSHPGHGDRGRAANHAPQKSAASNPIAGADNKGSKNFSNGHPAPGGKEKDKDSNSTPAQEPGGPALNAP